MWRIQQQQPPSPFFDPMLHNACLLYFQYILDISEMAEIHVISRIKDLDREICEIIRE